MRVDGLGEGTEFGEGVVFADAGDFILDLGREPMVQLQHRAASPHWTRVASRLKSTRYFTMC